MSGIGNGAGRLRIAVTGTTGFIGAAVVPNLRARGHQVICLVRNRSHMRPGDVFFDLNAAPADTAGLEGLDAVVHLAGESLFGIWTEPKKGRIRSTRKAGTHLLCSVLASLKKPPPLFFCASAVGIYGDRGNRELDENAPAGKGFLADVAVPGNGVPVVLQKHFIPSRAFVATRRCSRRLFYCIHYVYNS